MLVYDIGYSALRSQQIILSTTGQNIANSTTPGYHRQRVDLASRSSSAPVGLQIGSGVDIAQIRRIRDESIEQSLFNLKSALSASESNTDVYSRIEQALTPGTGAIQERLGDFFNRLEDVANNPSNVTARKAFVEASSQLAESINQVGRQWRDLQESLAEQAQSAVDQVNSLSGQLFEINRQINLASGSEDVPNALLDQRDQVVTDLSSLVNVTVQSGRGRANGISLGDSGYVRGNANQLQLVGSVQEGLSLVVNPDGREVVVTGGKLKALLDQVNQQIPKYISKLDSLASTLIGEVNRLHNTGLPSTGGFQQLIAAYPVSDPISSLASQKPTSEVVGGELYVTLTNSATGVRGTSRVIIDPQSDSLQSVIGKLDQVPGLSAIIDPLGRSVFTAEPGYRFDFSGRLDADPQKVNWTGTAVAHVGGDYSGSENDQWTWQIAGSGQVGVTPGLSLEVRNQNGDLISTQNIGEGYEPGTQIEVGDGVSIELSAGTVVGGDSLSSSVIANADRTGILNALGVNPIFLGDVSGGFTVRKDLLTNPLLTSLSRNGVSGDAQIAENILQLRTSKISGEGGLTPVEELAGLTAEIGIDSSNSKTEMSFLQDQTDALLNQQQAISGVNVDEEMVTMIQSQQSYQAAARYLSTISNVLDELFAIVK